MRPERYVTSFANTSKGEDFHAYDIVQKVISEYGEPFSVFYGNRSKPDNEAISAIVVYGDKAISIVAGDPFSLIITLCDEDEEGNKISG